MSQPNPYTFPLKPKEYAPAPVPSMQEWEMMWSVWDLVTTKMVPAKALMEQPIPLRNPLLFYLGHIPTFQDIHLTRATNGKPTEPARYHDFFERGIDPDVNDPTQCHDHSELPEVWPELSEILDYREKVKSRIKSLYDDGRAENDRCVGRALWIGFEHEGLHLETFLFMSMLSPNQLPPPDIPRPDFEALAKKAVANRVENKWFTIPEQEFTIGYHDPESDDGPNRFFAWDNEREPYNVKVPKFEAQARPISNGEYANYLVNEGIDTIPILWVEMNDPSDTAIRANGHITNGHTTNAIINGHVTNDSITNGHHTTVHDTEQESEPLKTFISRHGVRTVWGPIPLSQALDWPVMASYNEVAGYAKWAGAEIPSLHQVRSIHEYAEKQQQKHQGTGSTPDSSVNKDFHTNPEAIFVDLSGRNVGFQNFHPMPVTQNGGRLCGLADLGGAGEWTSDLFAPQPGFKPMKIYPGYSADFMDGKHMAIVGGSWALHPRIAGRKSFLNWWQKNYFYPWVTVRLIKNCF